MKNLFFTLLAASLLLHVSPVMAQTAGKITGKISDKNDKPLQSVTVSLLKSKDSSLVKSAVSTADGGYEFLPKPECSYLINYAMVGFENKYSDSFYVKKAKAMLLKICN